MISAEKFMREAYEDGGYPLMGLASLIVLIVAMFYIPAYLVGRVVGAICNYPRSYWNKTTGGRDAQT